MSQDINMPGTKIATAWGLVGISTWAEAASAIAFFYTLALFGEWAWKKIIRPFLVARGYMKANRRKTDEPAQ